MLCYPVETEYTLCITDRYMVTHIDIVMTIEHKSLHIGPGSAVVNVYEINVIELFASFYDLNQCSNVPNWFHILQFQITVRFLKQI